MNKKVCLCCLGLLFSLLIVLYFWGFNNPEKKVLKSKKEYVTNSFDAISMLYETEVGSGEYQTTTDTTWPSSGYIFNETLSKCENGGTVSWNDATNKVTMKTNISDKCYVYFDKYGIPIISEVTTSNITTGSITLNVTASGGTNNVATYYYSKDNGSSYISSPSSNYTFSGLTAGTTYNFKVYVKDIEGYSSSTSSISATTENAILLADYIKSLYTSQGTNGIYYHTSSLANSAADNSYRYAGANPNNYVCFGSDAATCSSDNLYRIIGVFDNEVKLIKSTSYGTYHRDSENDNTWSTSDIRTTLNTTYYNTLSTTWQNKIATHTWKVGGMENGFLSNAKTAYNYEVGSSSSSTTDSMKIGLMYVSDYYYGATNFYWTYPGYSNSGADYRVATSTNWLYLGSFEWTISPRVSSEAIHAFFVHSTGYVSSFVATWSYAVRPCFYLSSSTTYISGSGTSSDPFRIN